LNFFLVALQSKAGRGLFILEGFRSHTTTYHSQQDFSGRVISLSQRPLPNNTHQSQETGIHDLGEFRTRNLSRRAAADQRLKPRGYGDRPLEYGKI